MLFADSRAQTAGAYVRHGLLRGLSLGVRVLNDDLSCWSPSEWEPRQGRLDVQTRHRIQIEEISPTPTPRQTGAVVHACW